MGFRVWSKEGPRDMQRVDRGRLRVQGPKYQGLMFQIPFRLWYLGPKTPLFELGPLGLGS